MKKTLIFKASEKPTTIFDFPNKDGFSFEVWKPTWKQPVPPRKPKKYFSYFLFLKFGLFKNNNYASFAVFKNGVLVSSFLMVPAHFKWPFMGKNDVQIIYVMTNINFRGQKMAEKTIRIGIDMLESNIENFWYVTDTENFASIKTCTNMGFEVVGEGFRSGVFKILNLKK